MTSSEAMVVGALHEIGVGVTDTEDAIDYWRSFGYRPGPDGKLSAPQAEQLYGVNSALKSTRLLHQDADHGLLRLMQWDEPTGDGLNMARLRTKGNRWGVHKTDDVMTLLNHAEVLAQQGAPVNLLGPIINAHVGGYDGPPARPFREPLVCLRELQIFQPLYQLMITKRYNLELPLYGQIDATSLFRSSQVCHAATVNAEPDLTPFAFYDEVLGLKRMSLLEVPYIPGNIATIMFDLEEGDTLSVIDFDELRSEQPFDQQRSGRLRIFNISSTREEEDRLADSRPGKLGYSLYTYRVNDVDGMRDKAHAAGATEVTGIVEDEFGQRAFSFCAPDGYFWTLMAA